MQSEPRVSALECRWVLSLKLEQKQTEECRRQRWRTFCRYYGVLFASGNCLFGLSKLSVWWLRLGISMERIKPGHPQQNGRHERMHLTLKKETTRPPGANGLQQQARFDAFVQEYNLERPHEALGMKPLAQVCSTSSRPYRGLPELSYPLHDRGVLATACGRIC